MRLLVLYTIIICTSVLATWVMGFFLSPLDVLLMMLSGIPPHLPIMTIPTVMGIIFCGATLALYVDNRFWPEKTAEITA